MPVHCSGTHVAVLGSQTFSDASPQSFAVSHLVPAATVVSHEADAITRHAPPDTGVDANVTGSIFDSTSTTLASDPLLSAVGGLATLSSVIAPDAWK